MSATTSTASSQGGTPKTTKISEAVIRIAGNSQDGIQAIGGFLARLAGRSDQDVMTYMTIPSTISGGPSIFQVRMGTGDILSAGDQADFLVAFYQHSYESHLSSLRPGGVLIYDADHVKPDPEDRRFIAVPVPITSGTVEASGGAAKDKGKNIYVLGLLARIFSLEREKLALLIKERFGGKNEDIVRNAMVAFDAGYAWPGDGIRDIFRRFDTNGQRVAGGRPQVTMDGNQALTYGLLAAGVRYADGAPVKDRFYQGEGVFKFKLGPTKHQFLIGARYYDRDVRSYFFTGNTVTQNFFTGGPRLLVSTFGLSIDPAARNAYLYTRTLDEAFYAVDQIDLFDGRLKLLAGARNAGITNKKTVTNLTERTQRETTPQFGLWFEVVKDIALFANYSKTFEPQYNIDTFGVLSPNIQGEGKEIGAKTSFHDNMISGTFSLYEVTRKGEVRRDFVREQITGVLPLFIPGGDQRAPLGAQLHSPRKRAIARGTTAS